LGLLCEQGLKIVSNQVQFSVLDSRPEQSMIALCRKYDVKILVYGVLLGGFLSEKYLNLPEPTAADLSTASLKKYFNMIQAWGGWMLFQELLETMHQISEKHQCSIANVATSLILQKPAVAGVIIGTRLGISEHMQDNSNVFELSLDTEDLDSIKEVTSRSNDLFELIGDCGSEYR